jgi:hypothetical protein
VSALPKTATELLKLVIGEIKYMTETLKIKVTAWCTDASGESASMRRLLIQKMPSIIVVDCWAHQVHQENALGYIVCYRQAQKHM